MIFLMFVLLLALAPGCSRSGASDAPVVQAAPPAIVVQVAKVEARDIERLVEAVGTLDPNESVTVSNQVEGLVDKVLVDLGDQVDQGQLIAQLDTRELDLAVQQQRAALQQELARLGLADENATVDDAATSIVRQAEASFKDASNVLDRTKKLYGEQVIPKQQLDSAQARFDMAEAAVGASRESVRNIRATILARKAAVDLAVKKRADARIVSPMAGFIQERFVTAGQFLKNNSTVFTIVQNSPLKLHADVPETAIRSIGRGRSVRFMVDAVPGRMFEGKITRLSPSVNQESRTLKLEAVVVNPDGALRPGLFARVTIQTGQLEKALVVPAEAVFTFAGLEKLFVIENGKASERIVRTGVHVGGAVEIVEGVKEGEQAAISNLGNLQQGREVSIR